MDDMKHAGGYLTAELTRSVTNHSDRLERQSCCHVQEFFLTADTPRKTCGKAKGIQQNTQRERHEPRQTMKRQGEATVRTCDDAVS